MSYMSITLIKDSNIVKLKFFKKKTNKNELKIENILEYKNRGRNIALLFYSS